MRVSFRVAIAVVVVVTGLVAVLSAINTVQSRRMEDQLTFLKNNVLEQGFYVAKINGQAFRISQYDPAGADVPTIKSRLEELFLPLFGQFDMYNVPEITATLSTYESGFESTTRNLRDRFVAYEAAIETLEGHFDAMMQATDAATVRQELSDAQAPLFDLSIASRRFNDQLLLVEAILFSQSRNSRLNLMWTSTFLVYIALALLFVVTMAGYMWVRFSQSTQRQLLKAKEAAERANAAKDDFLANMSHELRTPLSGIFGMARMLDSHVSGKEATDQLRNLTQCATFLQRLIEDMLDLERLESGRLSVQPRPTKIAECTSGTFAVIQEVSERKGLRFESRVRPADLVLDVDGGRLNQVLVNVLDNAVKFTDAGEIICSLSYDNGSFLIDVRDTGEGIPHDLQTKVFDRFNQGHRSLRKSRQGLGIGLALVRGIVTDMGGTIDLESKPGHGTRVQIALPLEPGEIDEPTVDVPAASAGNRQILVAEDEAVNLMYLSSLLKRNGYRVIETSDGVEALSVLKTQAVECALMDIGLPKMSGLEVIEAFRTDATRAYVPIVAVTAHANPNDLARILAAGADAVVTKPYHESQILQTLRERVDANEGRGRRRAEMHRLP